MLLIRNEPFLLENRGQELRIVAALWDGVVGGRQTDERPPMKLELLLALERRPGLGDEFGVLRAGDRRIELLEPLPGSLLVGLQRFIGFLERGQRFFRLLTELLLHTRGRMLLERGGNRISADRFVLFELAGGHEQACADGVEGQRARVGRQVAHIDLHPEQIAERVFVFATVEPSHRDPASLIGEALASDDHRLGEHVEEVGLGRRLRLGLFGGRHLTRVECTEHLLPPLGGCHAVEREREIVDTEVGLRRLPSMACRTVGRQKLLVPRVQDGPRRRGCDRSGACGKHARKGGAGDEGEPLHGRGGEGVTEQGNLTPYYIGRLSWPQLA